MIIKCLNCSGALRFDPVSKQMMCDFCMSSFAPETVGYEEQKTITYDESKIVDELGNTVHDEDVNLKEAYMECNIFKCGACGAEVTINGVESSTFCIYCGQPTIVFDRVSREKKPEYIVPFSVTKEDAIKTIRKKLNAGMFVPDEIKNFEMDRIRGIYIPYWLCDIDYHGEMVLKGTVKSGKNSVTRYFYRNAKCDFRKITLDASFQLNDETSQRLEPYNVDHPDAFDVSYLSGYYADRYDVDQGTCEDIAKGRAMRLFNEAVIATVKASDVSVLKSKQVIDVKDTKYAMLPAWFMTFRYQDEPYTFLVNGQTGKVVGGVPYEKSKVYPLVVILGIILTIICTAFVSLLFGSVEIDEDTIKLVLMVVAAGVMAFWGGKKSFDKVEKSIKLTKSKTMLNYVNKRQDGD